MSVKYGQDQTGMHLTEADILLYLDKRLKDDERRNIELHLSGCAQCVSQLATMSRLNKRIAASTAPKIPKGIVLKAEQIVRGKAPNGHVSSWFHTPVSRLALGGMAVIIIGLAVLLTSPTSEVSRYRSTERISPPSLLHPADGSTFRPGEVFQWRTAPEAIGYRFTLHDHVGLPVWEQVVSETTVTLPQSVILQQGGHYLWQVESLFPDQSTQRSQLNALTFSP